MEARVKDDNRWKVVMAQSVEYIQKDYRPVPEADEAHVEQHTMLQVKGRAAPKTTLKELRDQAQEFGVEGYANMKREALEQAIADAS